MILFVYVSNNNKLCNLELLLVINIGVSIQMQRIRSETSIKPTICINACTSAKWLPKSAAITEGNFNSNNDHTVFCNKNNTSWPYHCRQHVIDLTGFCTSINWLHVQFYSLMYVCVLTSYTLYMHVLVYTYHICMYDIINDEILLQTCMNRIHSRWKIFSQFLLFFVHFCMFIHKLNLFPFPLTSFS